jgi:hypothetical protein
MSNQPFLNDPDALDNKTLNGFYNTLTANSLDIDNLNVDTVNANTVNTTDLNTTNINGTPETNFVLTDGSREITSKQIIAQSVYNTRNIFANGQNPATNIITDIDGTAQRQIFVETTSVDTDGCTIDRVSYTGSGSELPVIDIYVKLATLKVVHNQGGLGPNEYPIQCPGDIGFTLVNDFTANKYGWVRLFFYSGAGTWLLQQITP